MRSQRDFEFIWDEFNERFDLSAPPVETEKEKPALPKPVFGYLGLFGSKPTKIAPTEDKKKDETPSGGGLFGAKTSSKPATSEPVFRRTVFRIGSRRLSYIVTILVIKVVTDDVKIIFSD